MNIQSHLKPTKQSASSDNDANDTGDNTGDRLPDHLQRALQDGNHPLKVWRRHRELSMGALGRLANIPTETIFYIEKHNEWPDDECVEQLAKALGIAPEALD